MQDTKVENIELEDLDSANPSEKLVGSKSLDVIKDVEVRLTAVVGGVTLSVGEMFNLVENSVLTLDALVDQPIDLILNEQVVARGALVVADDNFAVQITEVPDARLA